MPGRVWLFMDSLASPFWYLCILKGEQLGFHSVGCVLPSGLIRREFTMVTFAIGAAYLMFKTSII